MHQTTAQPTALTFADVAAMPADVLGELVQGVWVPSTFHTAHHGEIVAEIGFRLAQYVRSHPEWIATMGEAGMKLELRGADVVLIRADRMPKEPELMAGWKVRPI